MNSAYLSLISTLAWACVCMYATHRAWDIVKRVLIFVHDNRQNSLQALGEKMKEYEAEIADINEHLAELKATNDNLMSALSNPASGARAMFGL